MSEIDWQKVATGLHAEAARFQEMAEAKPELGLARISAPAILVLRGIAAAIEQALAP